VILFDFRSQLADNPLPGGTTTLLFVHTPRTGGTSVRQALISCGHYNSMLYVAKAYNPQEDLDHRDNKFNPHLDYRSVSLELLENVYSISFVRNPWDRFVSWYRYSNSELTFDRFVRVKLGLEPEPEGKRNSNRERNPSTQEAYWLHSDLVFRFEDLESEVRRLADLLYLKLHLKWLNGSRSLQEQHKGYRDYYDPETVRLVAEAEEPTISTFGYEF